LSPTYEKIYEDLTNNRDKLKNLIIIRGPVGIGKTTIANSLVAKLGPNTSYLIDLNEMRTDIFHAYMTSSQKYDNIIAEMFYGGFHTTNPTEWLRYFPDDTYNKLSVVLTAPLEDCLSGVIRRKHPSHFGISLDSVRTDYYDFYNTLKPLFRELINFQEIEVDNSRTRSPVIAVNLIFDKLQEI
jgi:hypothetical protein